MACIPSAATAEQTHRCIAFYGVPNGPEGRGQFEYVDPCWGGAHVTVAGFTAYPTGTLGTGDSLTASEALAVPRKIANDPQTALCDQTPSSIYHMNDGTAGHKANGFWENRSEPHTKTLKLGDPTDTKQISGTWKDLSMDLLDQSVETYYKGGMHGTVDCESDPLDKECWNHNFPHVTFDTCSCPDDTGVSCPSATWSTWGDPHASPRMDWLLIPVEYTGNGGDCSTGLPAHDGQCHQDSNDPSKQMACTSKVPLVWHWNRSMVVRCPEPSAAQLALFALLVLPTLSHSRPRSH